MRFKYTLNADEIKEAITEWAEKRVELPSQGIEFRVQLRNGAAELGDTVKGISLEGEHPE